MFTKDQIKHAIGAAAQHLYAEAQARAAAGQTQQALSGITPSAAQPFWHTGMILDNLEAPNGKKIKPPKKDYNTVGVRFLRGSTLHKVYTYRVRKGAKVHLGQELVAPTPTGDSVVVVVEIHKTPQDNGGFNYKFVTNKVAPL